MIEIVAASPCDAEAFSQTPLGCSLQRLRFDARLVPCLTLANTTGLSQIYNQAIRSNSPHDILVFIHDDVWIDDYFFADGILAGLDQFDVLGVAGNTRLVDTHTTWFANGLVDEPNFPYLSGAVAHGQDPFGKVTYYGPTLQPCELLDGVLLAARRSTLCNQGVFFDPQFRFHFYDLDFCRTARQRGLSLGTWPLAITHQSSGRFGSPDWHQSLILYQGKWTTNKRLLASPAKTGPSVVFLAQQARELKQQGQFEAALTTYQQALALDETMPELWFNFGNLLQSLNRYPDAEDAFRRALALNADFFQAQLNLVNLLRNQGHKEASVKHYRQALQLKPDLSLGYRNLGLVLLDLKHPEEALEVFTAWSRLKPNQSAPLNGIGIARKALAQFDLAHQAFEQALSLEPNGDDTLNNLGTLLRLMNRSPEALYYLRQAQTLNPDNEVTLSNLIDTLLSLGSISDALQSSETLLAKHPQSAKGYLLKGYALVYQARILEACQAFEQCWQLDPTATDAVSNALFSLFYHDYDNSATLQQELKYWAQRLPQRPLEFQFQQRNRDPHRPLKVGYLSADFRSHPVAFFLEPILTHHNPRQLDITCYDTTERPDDQTRRLQALVPCWRPCFALSDEALAHQIYHDKIDILVDLSGHTQGNRAAVIACKPAPLQILYIGYPGTTGQRTMDYIISDAVVTPPEYEALYTENILRVDGSFWCFQPHNCAPEPGPLPALKNGFITFGAFNNSPKLSETTLRLWACVLASVPNSRLLIKNLACADSQIQTYFQQRLIAQGASAEQLIFEPPTSELAQFLAAYQRVDICLDTFPYNGGTTTCESLLMGVPVVTLRGQHFFSRMSHGLLTHLGLGQLSAASEEEFITIAQGLTQDLNALQDLRASLRQQLFHSPICDARRAAQSLEKAYRQAWQQYVGFSS
jgi:predicted O-linked N-acetylglucosamine transferase (SPINDLY family)